MQETSHPLEEPWVEGMPPDEAWIKDPLEKMPTPMDSRGLIIVDELIEGVKSYIDPTYKYPTKPSVHHIYWPRCDYDALEGWSDGYVPARRFRELPINKLYVPRYFENVLHTVTIRPPMPSPEVMGHQIEAWDAARNLFNSVRNALRAERLSRRRLELQELTPEEEEVGREIMDEIFQRHFRGVQRHLGALSLVPEEYWPFNPELPSHLAAGQIGEVMLRGHQRRTKAVHRQYFRAAAQTSAQAA
jgi:hypothetical protein